MRKEHFARNHTVSSRVRLFTTYCLERDTVLRSTKTALVVGTALALINHGQQIFTAQFALTWALPTAVSYLVPFTVATYAQIQGKLQRDRLRLRQTTSTRQNNERHLLAPYPPGNPEPVQTPPFAINRQFLFHHPAAFGDPEQGCNADDGMWQFAVRQGAPCRHLQIAPRFTLPMKPQGARDLFTPTPFSEYTSNILHPKDHVYQGVG